MSKKLTAFVLLIAAGIVVTSFMFNNKDEALTIQEPPQQEVVNTTDESEMIQDNTEMQSTTEVAANEESEIAQKEGAYVDYSEAVLANATGSKILFFHADWCPQCNRLEQDILANTIPANTTIFKVDFDNSTSLRQRHGVTLQTTLISVNDNGDTIKKFGAYSNPTFQAVVDNLL